MAVFKCKMCGADLNITEDVKITECDYCGSTQTLPSVDNEKKINLFNRANRLRMASEFDKAASIYENIIAEFPEEAEAYWGLCLCNYGIEYVDDPLTAKKIPTCHRASFEKLSEDENFQLAMEYGDVYSQRVLRNEAREIDRIMEEILAISKNEKPYDVFICYKETDSMTGQRTVDSVFAQDIYDALTDKGLKVFFARITLEEKLGRQYEPYIFAALNTAKVMLAVGTCYENFHAVWVKNEWSRFLKLTAKDKSRVLIPCFKDMDAYDLPDEFKMLQAQDMGKIGFVQDLTRGILKIVTPEEAVTAAAVKEVIAQTASVSVTAEPLLRRAFLFLEDGNWTEADSYCEKVLDLDPENARAYLGKLLACYKVKTEDVLSTCRSSYENDNNYQKILRFGDEELVKKVSDALSFIKERLEAERVAAEKARKAAEEAKIKADNEREARILECRELIAQLQNIQLGHSVKKALAEKETELIQTKIRLKTLLENFPETIKRMNAVNDTIDRLNREIPRLQAERESLGMFSGKRKSELDAELARLISQKSQSERIWEHLNTELFGCKTEEEITARIEKVDNELSSIIMPSDEKCTEAEIINKLMSDEIGKNMYSEYNMVKNIMPGSSKIFGKYYQEYRDIRDKKDIEWIVLGREGDRVLLLSKYALAAKQYKYPSAKTTWAQSSIREWLNTEFYDEAFSPEEKKSIITAEIMPHRNPEYKMINQGEATKDNVFLLSIEEVNTYLKSAESRVCEPTLYAAKTTYTQNNASWWWLRTIGRSSDFAAGVDFFGRIIHLGDRVDSFDSAVRPAIWVSVLNFI